MTDAHIHHSTAAEPHSDRILQDGRCPEPSCVSKRSKSEPLMFKDGGLPAGHRIQEGPGSPEPSCVSSQSKSEPLMFKDGRLPAGHSDLHEQLLNHSPDLNSIFRLLEQNIAAFAHSELRRIERSLSPDAPECSEVRGEVRGEVGDDGTDGEQRRSIAAAFLKITLHFLREMKQHELADSLQCETKAVTCQRKLKKNMKKKFQVLFEGIAKAGNPTLLRDIYTELYITEGDTGDVNDEHEVRQIEAASRKHFASEATIRCEDIFKGSSAGRRPVRTVVTKGVAGIGKTILTQKFTLDWAEGKANQDVHFMFPFTFRELNVLKGKKYSLVKLLRHFFTETKDLGANSFDKPQVVLILDGLDECRLPLDFQRNKTLSDVTQSASLDVLLTNLISGKLLPSARLWITTRPAAANQIPPQCVDMVTEVRGFTDPQKDQYFRKRFRDVELSSRITSHVMTSRSLHIMCHIPVFCWITATVLEHVLKTREGGQLPKTLTEMYIHFLVVQSKLKSIKYDGGAETDEPCSPKTTEMILSLGKLAFVQLQKGNIIFYESDLTECDIDIRAATVYSGVLTQIFKEESGLYQERVFCFVHLSVQEFLAAVHVHFTFVNSGVDLMSEVQLQSKWASLLGNTAVNFYQSAVDKALESPNGHLDLFLRFLLGLSLKTNQDLLHSLQRNVRSCPQASKKTVQYIKKMIRTKLSPERSINLFHCLNELKDHSLLEEIQQYLASGRVFTQHWSPAHWSALVFILLSSEKDLSVFDLKKYCPSEEGFLKLLPVARCSHKSLLDDCNLSPGSCKVLTQLFSSPSCTLTKLDLSNNDLQDSGVAQLCIGLESPNCRLQTLCLNQTGLTEKCCEHLSMVLSGESSHLKRLDLSHNKLQDSGVQTLCCGLRSKLCKLEAFRLVGCQLTAESCRLLASVLSSPSSSLTELDLSMNVLRDVGVHLISPGLQSPNCKLRTLRLRFCNLSEKSCEVLPLVVGSKSSHLRVLDVSNNDLTDWGAVKLSAGLKHPQCRLKTLSLSGCRLTEKGCASVVSALVSDTKLRDLDLSYNHPGDLEMKLNPSSLHTVRLDHGGVQRLEPLLKKYACYLLLDPDSAHIDLVLSGDNRKVTGAKLCARNDHHSGDVLCRDGLSGRCYWEVDWRGVVSVGVTYRGDRLGKTVKSWMLTCSRGKYSIWHNDKETRLKHRPETQRVAAYVDEPTGILSFFCVLSPTRLRHLHTFSCSFTEPVRPVFRLLFGSSVHLCPLQET